MRKKPLRENSSLFDLMFGGAVVASLMIASSTLPAGADEEIAVSALTTSITISPVPSSDASPVFTPAQGVLAMQPIPDASATAATIAADAPAQDEKHCLATAIYFEARGESSKGQKAVGEVVLARTHTRGRPKTICGVVYEGSERRTGCQFSFTCDHVPDVVRVAKAWTRAERIAAAVMTARGKSVARGATFYHAGYVNPSWAGRMVKVAQIGSHVFYRPKRGHLL